jgi:hypothetical protein
MDNIYPPTGGDPGDQQPTEQFWRGQGTPPGSEGPGGQGPGYVGHWHQPGRQAPPPSRRRKTRMAVGITLAALLAGGGVIAGVALAGPSLSSVPTASTGTAGGTGTAGTGGQAALLNAALTAADKPNAAVTTTAASAAGTPGTASAGGPATTAPTPGPAARRCINAVRAARAAGLTGHPLATRRATGAAIARCRLLRRRIIRFFLLRGVDGQFTFRTADGTLRTLAYERGVIESVTSGSSITVKAADGTVSTWDLVSNTVVRERGGKVSESTLAVGEPVWVGGPVVSGTKDARLIFVRPPSG